MGLLVLLVGRLRRSTGQVRVGGLHCKPRAKAHEMCQRVRLKGRRGVPRGEVVKGCNRLSRGGAYPERQVVAQQLHDEGRILVALLVERVEL